MRSPYVYEGTPTARVLRYVSQRGPIGAPLLLLVGGFLAFCVVAKIFSSFLPADAVPDSSCVVDLGYARYEGIFEENTTRFLGVRYAAAPVGEAGRVLILWPSKLSECTLRKPAVARPTASTILSISYQGGYPAKDLWAR